ncbi:MAG: hypothetical protein WD627_11795 [Actinomycetota bacterium]
MLCNITDLVASALRYQGFEVQTAGNGRAAISGTESFRPHLIHDHRINPGSV